ncbi:zona occludens toxin [Methylobacter tundripaludum]|uniref:Zona occludens toxin n=1 Tax=Methylobacter tundripaludum TaxID=173365 RepID=A0A2S6H3A2_9GAMM|nr:zonular occludens toxin domain-containing protein [Methylobacter tundripaludum]PPK71900.1 zona occludens toxin [Methylobacter tundripaludum]
MPINVYTGLMRSGKSYEVVSEVIVEAIALGRRVVTNVDGISNDLVREYVSEKRKIDIDELGHVFHVVNEDVFKADFFPYFDDHRGEHTDTIVQPGDLVCIDEAWRFWGSGSKILNNHKSFFLEHGHFTHPDTGIACDLVMMIQDMGTLHRSIKAVVAFSFRTHKKVSLGMGNTYSVTMWEGSKMVKGSLIGSWVRRYDKKVFPLYSSFKGGADGKMVNVDSRQNIFNNPKLWLGIVALFVVGFFSLRTIWGFFHPTPVAVVADTKTSDAKGLNGKGSASAAVPGTTQYAAVNPAPVPAAPAFSESWRYVGQLKLPNTTYSVVMGSSGHVRFESPSVFHNSGLASVGDVDGSKVTSFSGSSVGLKK